jgi:hypothetical protein
MPSLTNQAEQPSRNFAAGFLASLLAAVAMVDAFVAYLAWAAVTAVA